MRRSAFFLAMAGLLAGQSRVPLDQVRVSVPSTNGGVVELLARQVDLLSRQGAKLIPVTLGAGLRVEVSNGVARIEMAAPVVPPAPVAVTCVNRDTVLTRTATGWGGLKSLFGTVFRNGLKQMAGADYNVSGGEVVPVAGLPEWNADDQVTSLDTVCVVQ